jgi:hypothetical protein
MGMAINHVGSLQVYGVSCGISNCADSHGYANMPTKQPDMHYPAWLFLCDIIQTSLSSVLDAFSWMATLCCYRE